MPKKDRALGFYSKIETTITIAFIIERAGLSHQNIVCSPPEKKRETDGTLTAARNNNNIIPVLNGEAVPPD